jgi:hypothetical protein
MADMLNDMMLCEELFHTPTGVACADFITEGRRETWPIRSKRFRTWMQRCYYQATGGAASAAEIRSALDLLEARAQFDVRSTSALRNMADAFISTSLMSNGGPSTSDLTAGGRMPTSALPPACRDIAAVRTRTRWVH